MHVTIDVIADELEQSGAGKPLVLAREERLSLSGACLNPEEATPSTLLICSSGGLGAGLPIRNVLLVIGEDEQPPVIGQDPFASLAILHTRLSVNEVHALVCSSLLSLSNWDSRMLEAIAAHHDISNVLAIAAERLTNPIALFDSSGSLLTFAGNVEGDLTGTIWENVLGNRYSPVEYYTREEQREIERLVQRPWPFQIAPSRCPSHHNLSRAVIANGQTVGSVGLVDVQAPFTRAQVALVELVVDRLRLAMALRLGGHGETDDSSFLLRSLLNGDKVDKVLAMRHMARLGWGESSGFVLACLSLPQNVNDESMLRMRIDRVASTFGRSICIPYDNHIVVLHEGLVSHDDVRIVALLTRLDLRGALSEPFADIFRVRVAYEQCRLAMDTQSEEEVAPLVSFADQFERVVTRAMDPSLDRRALCHQAVLGLVREGWRGDLERGSSLVRELYTYLMNGCNSHLTARQLYLHRNTLSYHIEQLERLLGGKLDEMDSSHRLFLIFSCLMALGNIGPNR